MSSDPSSTIPGAAELDYDTLLRANLERVFNERDADKREAALAELFADEPVMYEPTHVVRGRDAISTVAGNLLDQFGPTFRFTPVGRAVGHHGLGSLSWQAGPDDGPVAVTGSDVAEIVDGKIVRLWVLLNPPAA
ncbi:nuclear transport factor 2 family protein [Methylobacterium sp. EM32]|uniref:nuclear transport factor 2 family protein n=1 Tax=Methylobacterium sp. EM32 TaxID=3163481 RepID=UPI0033A13800